MGRLCLGRCAAMNTASDAFSDGDFAPRFEYLFNFDNTFEIHDDIEVLKRMGMACGLESGSCSAEDLKIARSLVPKALEPYVTGLLPAVLGGRGAGPPVWTRGLPLPRPNSHSTPEAGTVGFGGQAARGDRGA